jgi:acyl transferase domain-containing protein/thioesterase domain-containing protein/acyl carrier protein
MKNTNLIDRLEGSEIAVIGMAVRLPGADTPEAFWRNLKAGVESVVFLTDDELIASGVSPALLQDPDYVRASVPLEDFDKFDAQFFGFSPRDAAIMDPQHRVFLECAWEALERAGYDPAQYDGSIGVYGGCGMNAYMMYNLLSNPELMASAGEFLVRHLGNDKDFLTTRVSYNLDLKGPSVNVQTACSTSLVAVHIACQSLLGGECDIAAAGGVTIQIPHRTGYIYRPGEVLSSDGHCRAFDAKAEGTIFGSGAGIVVLKRLKDALLDGDTVQAVIRGSAINNDGSAKVGYLAPSVEGQAKAVAEAIAVAGVAAETITYIETHGTGTSIGDPIEVTALTQAFNASTDRKGFCAIGSLKTNIGHLDTAAGVASLIKTVLALRHKGIPASLNFERPNPAIDFANSPFYVCSSYENWEADGSPLRAGVNSLGVGGTNSFVVVEESPATEASGPSRPHQLILLSARTASALDAATARLADYLKSNPGTNLADAAYTLKLGRKPFERRRAVVCRDLDDAIEALGDPRRVHTGRAREGDPHIVFMFPGGGAQYPSMGAELYDNESVYREAIDQCFELLAPELGQGLRKCMFPRDEEISSAREQLENPLNSVLSVFITEYALAQLWMSWGVKPAAMIGHSLGEYTAACLSGVMSLEDALAIVALRGQIFEQMPEGAMLIVPLSEGETRALLIGDLSIAAVNGPSLTVVSGRTGEIAELEKELAARQIDSHRIKINVAAHSSLLDPFSDGFAKDIASITLSPPTVPFVSNTTGDWIADSEATDHAYWARHLRQTVRFADGLQRALGHPDCVLIEVGPGTTLISLARQQTAASPFTALASLPHPSEPVSDLQFILASLGRLWMSGQKIDWRSFYSRESRQRIELPTYPFERARYWIAPGMSHAPETKALTKKASVAEWFYRPVWKQRELVPATGGEPLRWLVFADKSRFSSRVINRVRESGEEAILVAAGEEFSWTGDAGCSINIGRREDYDTLINDLAGSRRLPHRILYLWPALDRAGASLDESLESCFYGLMHLAQAMGEQDLPHPIHIGVISAGAQQVGSEKVSRPEQALTIGACRVIPQECAQITCAAIDIESGSNSLLIDQLIAEMRAASPDETVALRRNGRWAQEFESVSQPGGEKIKIKERGVYLITGGVGGIGLAMAGMLAASRARLILVSRHGLPERDQWERWLEIYGEDDETCQRIRAVQRLEEAGAEILLAQANVADLGAMRQVLSQARSRFGPINGVLHAAGIIDDELIQFKTRESAARVLDPKVRGVLALDELLKKERPDFFLLFSSTSSVAGLAGQIDYAAANSFLDAFARSKSPGATLTAAINWGIWQKVGMAARAASRGRRKPQPFPSFDGAHPLLGRAKIESDDYLVYENILDLNQQWVLSEHRTKDGVALIPGTAYIEMARAAVGHLTADNPIAINDLTFISPLIAADKERREVRVTLRRRGEDYDFAAASRARGETRWQEHALGRINCSGEDTAHPHPIETILRRCDCEDFCAGINRQKAQLNFGPRWENISRVYRGKGEAVARLELSEEFTADLEDYPLHPALLDMATGFAFSLIPGYELHDGVYVPASYRKLIVRGALRPVIYSHARCRKESDAKRGVAVFDVTITDEDGNVLVEIEEFIVRRLASSRELAAGKSVQSSGLRDQDAAPASSILALITQGILPEEGAEAVKKILSSAIGPQVVVSSCDLQSLIEESRAARPRAEASSALRLARPDLESSYTAPKNDVEKFLVRLWQELLGIERVGTEDNFFDLGGHSLMAVRMFAKIRKAYKSELGLAALLAAPTIAQLAALLGDGKETAKSSISFSSLVAIQPNGSRPPFFCIHGVGGNIVEYSHLTKYLPADQPFYGIQSASLSRKGPRLTRVEEMAAYYIEEVRRLQPEGPYYLAGSSFGGIVGYEMAQQLHEQGQRVALLALFDTYGPDYPRLLSTTTVLQRKIARVKLRASLHWSNLKLLDSGQRLAYVREKSRKALRMLNRKRRALARDFKKKLYDLLLPEVVALTRFKAVSHFRNALKRILLPEDIRAAQETGNQASLNYEPKPYLNTGKVVLFRATEQPSGIYPDPFNGWSGLIPDLEVCDVAGHHGSIIREPRVQALARLLNEYLDRFQGDSTPKATAMSVTAVAAEKR